MLLPNKLSGWLDDTFDWQESDLLVNARTTAGRGGHDITHKEASKKQGGIRKCCFLLSSPLE
jgi:hypothetical protein